MPLLHALFAGRSWLDTFLLVFAVAIMPAISALRGWQLARTPAERRNLTARYWQTLLRGWLVAVVVVVVWYAARRPLATLGLDWPIGMRGVWGFVFDALLAVVSAMQLAKLPQLARNSPEKAKAALKRLKITPRTREQLTVFLAVAVTAGVWEELLYRGFLMWFLAPAGVAVAVIVSSLIFALGHAYQGIRGMLVIAVVGLVFAVAYAATGSLWWLMLAHALVDIRGGLAAYRLHRLLARPVAIPSSP